MTFSLIVPRECLFSTGYPGVGYSDEARAERVPGKEDSIGSDLWMSGGPKAYVV